MWPRFLIRPWRRLRGDERGVAAIEFALVVPIVIVVYLVGFEVVEASTVNRKLTDTTVQLANVTSQYTSMDTTDVSNVLNASVQIMTPYPTSPNITAVLTEVKVNSNKKGVTQWSCAYPSGTTALATGSKVTMPAGFQTSGAYFILVQTTYSYQPTIGSAFIGSIPMSNQIFMLPRASSSIPGPTTCP
jgi:Flp pilus assembly protein TadG